MRLMRRQERPFNLLPIAHGHSFVPCSGDPVAGGGAPVAQPMGVPGGAAPAEPFVPPAGATVLTPPEGGIPDLAPQVPQGAEPVAPTPATGQPPAAPTPVPGAPTVPPAQLAADPMGIRGLAEPQAAPVEPAAQGRGVGAEWMPVIQELASQNVTPQMIAESMKTAAKGGDVNLDDDLQVQDEQAPLTEQRVRNMMEETMTGVLGAHQRQIDLQIEHGNALDQEASNIVNAFTQANLPLNDATQRVAATFMRQVAQPYPDIDPMTGTPHPLNGQSQPLSAEQAGQLAGQVKNTFATQQAGALIQAAGQPTLGGAAQTQGGQPVQPQRGQHVDPQTSIDQGAEIARQQRALRESGQAPQRRF